jgi:multicomponent Na+:H+ antiporter subunit G
MNWDQVADVASTVCLLGGAFLAFAAGVGVLRFPDLLSRMHAGTKPQTLGLILVLVGLALRLRTGGAVWALVLVVVFQLLTAPVAAHLVGRAGYRTGKVRKDLLAVDDLTPELTFPLEPLEPGAAARHRPAPQPPDQSAPPAPPT